MGLKQKQLIKIILYAQGRCAKPQLARIIECAISKRLLQGGPTAQHWRHFGYLLC
jgi:hypothetical protein